MEVEVVVAQWVSACLRDQMDVARLPVALADLAAQLPPSTSQQVRARLTALQDELRAPGTDDDEGADRLESAAVRFLGAHPADVLASRGAPDWHTQPEPRGEATAEAASDEIQQVTARLAIYEALARMLEDPHLVLDLLLDADSTESAAERLSDRFGFSSAQTAAVLDLQFRRVTQTDRRRIVDEALRLREYLDGLSGRTRSSHDGGAVT